MVTLAGILLAPAVRYYLFENVSFYAGYMFFPGRMDTIFWGVLLAFLMRSEKYRLIASRHSLSLLIVGGLAFASVAVSNLGTVRIPVFIRFTALAIFYFIVMWVVVEQRFTWLNAALRTRFLTFTGMISYAAYMVHQLVNGLMHGLLFGSKPQLGSLERLTATGFSIVLVYAICYLSYRYFEGPILRAGKRAQYADPGVSDEMVVQKIA
jgi:peptidoglycan/LPS O-acetylase OafA/YrhL